MSGLVEHLIELDEICSVNMELHVLHDDESHCVVLKPAGMATHGRGKSTLLAALSASTTLAASSAFLQPVHRLDYGTRGPVLVAKSRMAFAALQTNWPQFQKTYHAWVVGKDIPEQGLVGFPIDGKRSFASFRCLGVRTWAVHEYASLVEWKLATGRTHQIRRQAAAMGHPVVGDSTYSTPPVYRGSGLHLTCTELVWNHPITHQELRVVCPPAKKMRRMVTPNFVPDKPSPFLPLFSPFKSGLTLP